MPPRRHLSLLAQAVAIWIGFWLAGLPHYYQQYSTVALALASIVLSVAISLAAIALLRRGSDATRPRRAFWYAFYYTVPFAALDTLYCGWWLGRGAAYLHEYWYLTVFYLTPWLTFPPTARLLHGRALPPRTTN